MIVKACFENESSLQAKIAFRDLSEVLCSAVFIGQEEQIFLGTGVSGPPIRNWFVSET